MAQTIGEQLKQAREARGLTLEQVSKETHIRVHYLEALEQGQRAALPSAVQGRGFLRMYADLLNLPAMDLLAAWDGKAPAAPVDESAAPGTSDTLASPTVTEAPRPATVPGAAPAADLPPASGPLAVTLSEESVVFPPLAENDQEETPASSLAIFREVGQVLLKQREGLGLSRAEVERYTRLRQRYIQALEEGRLDQLPSPVQGRGMLSNYASFLNLDEDKILLRFAEGLQARRIEILPKPEPQPVFNKRRPARQAPLWRRFLTPDLIFGVGVAAVILFFFLWTAARINSMRNTSTQPTPPSVASMLLTPGADATPNGTALAGAQAGTVSPAGGDNQAGAAVPADAENPLAAAGSETPASRGAAGGEAGPTVGADITGSASNAGTPIAPNQTATILPINKDPLQVYVVARQRAWLRVICDDKVKFLGRTVPGNAYAFSGTKRIELATGNAAALQVFYNQTDLGTLGTAGQVVGLVFSPDGGVMTPTAAFTATPTPTKPATATLLPSVTPQATATITPYIPNK